jgi:hypothetical protein
MTLSHWLVPSSWRQGRWLKPRISGHRRCTLWAVAERSRIKSRDAWCTSLSSTRRHSQNTVCKTCNHPKSHPNKVQRRLRRGTATDLLVNLPLIKQLDSLILSKTVR